MLILVVGPSGAGKDTVLGLARSALDGDPRFRFVRRTITRAADAGGEDHDAVTDAEFATRDFALQWEAHGLKYGIPIDIEADLAGGRVVIANISRGAIGRAAARYPVRVVEVLASPEILAQRLAARGRETAADIAARLARAVPIPDGVPVDRVVNDTTPDTAADAFVALLRREASHGRQRRVNCAAAGA
jgi:phosphonate metabolism protein PhnN/1,5-bisphosphokinase (PRPP-forming)